MLPDNVLSTSVVKGLFIGGRAYPVTSFYDYENGGIAIQDASKGLNYQVWKAYIDINDVILSSDTQPEFVAYTAVGIEEISFTFDRNMNFTLAFVQNGEAKLYWYDSAIAGMTVTNFGTAVSSPKVTHDDKRDLESSSSDVIFAYVKNGNLYYRQQRDRFATEYLLMEGVSVLKKIGMSDKLRLQFLYE